MKKVSTEKLFKKKKKQEDQRNATYNQNNYFPLFNNATNPHPKGKTSKIGSILHSRVPPGQNIKNLYFPKLGYLNTDPRFK